eukprot:NODE_35_length_36362_cov_0.944434.p14 type:complete len:300 gc:universal NODE_35_length_36362_cov_0.944434:34185-35084(+)
MSQNYPYQAPQQRFSFVDTHQTSAFDRPLSHQDPYQSPSEGKYKNQEYYEQQNLNDSYAEEENSIYDTSDYGRSTLNKNESTANFGNTKKRGCVSRPICYFLSCCCFLIVVGIILLAVVLLTFKVPSLDVGSITQGDPLYEVTKSGSSVSKRSFLDIFGGSSKVSASDIPENTDIKVNLIANLVIDNQNWYKLAIGNQVVQMFVKSDMSNSIGSGVLQSDIPANQKSNNQINMQVEYKKQGTPPAGIQYLFDKCDGTNQNIDLVFRAKVIVKTVDIPKTLPCPVNLQDPQLKQKIQDAQ